MTEQPAYKRFANKGFAIGHAKKVAGQASESAYVIGTDAEEVAKPNNEPGSDFLAVVVIETFADKLSDADKALFEAGQVYVREQLRPEDVKERQKMEQQQQAAEAAAPRVVEVTGYTGETVQAEIPKAAGRKGLAVRNGFSQPAAGTLTRMVWDEADRISAENKRPALGDEIRAVLMPKGFSGSTISQQYKAWRGFWGVTDEQIAAIEAELDAPKRAEIEAAKAEEKRLKEEEKRLRKEAKALETAAKAEQRKRDAQELKAAKQRDKEAAKAVKEQQRSEEAKAKLEEKLAKNSAIQAERMAEQQRKFEARQAEARKRQEARAEAYQKRVAEARAKLEALRAGAVASTNPGGDTSAPSTGEVADGQAGTNANAPESAEGAAA